MMWIEKIVSSKFSSKVRQSFNEAENFANPQIIKQFLVSQHQDSLQITFIEKPSLHPSP